MWAWYDVWNKIYGISGNFIKFMRNNFGQKMKKIEKVKWNQTSVYTEAEAYVCQIFPPEQ